MEKPSYAKLVKDIEDALEAVGCRLMGLKMTHSGCFEIELYSKVARTLLVSNYKEMKKDDLEAEKASGSEGTCK